MIVFPDDWDKQKNVAKKKRKHDPDESSVQEAAAGASTCHLSLPETKEVPKVAVDMIKLIHGSSKVSQATSIPPEFDLDVILTHVPFNHILSTLFEREQVDSNTNLPIVTKAYEESFMREPYAGEKHCASGSLCECNFIHPTNGFIGVEFILPGQEVTDSAQLCVLCSRKLTQKMFYDILFTGKESKACIQRYGNICNTGGEYARECMLACPTHAPLHCMPLPIMSHQRNKYDIYISNGIRCIRQLKVSYEDFCLPSTSD
jgi:hypothetical protein